MAFSAFNIGSQMVTLTGNKIPQLRLATKPVAGGTFTPSTLEAAFVMRSSLDYQFENAFLTKYKALMQNRLNFLTEKMRDAYTNVLNTSMAQQVGQDAALDTRADVRLDGFDASANAKLIGGVRGANGFEDIGMAADSDATFETSASNDVWRTPGKLSDSMITGGSLPEDQVAGWGRSLGGGTTPVQFRSLLEYTTGAGNVSGDINITMRAEDDPPVPEPVNVLMSALASITTAVTGPPPAPTYFNQKLEEHQTEYKTGGFWSAINYLYNFAPRELQYSYAVGYTVNSDEAGNDSYLATGNLVDSRDNVGIAGDPPAFLSEPQRVKWASFEPTEGYQHEISGTSSRYATVINRENAWLQGSNQYGADVWYDPANFSTSNAGAQAKIVDGVLFQSGTYTYNNGVMINSNNSIAAVAGAGGKLVESAGTNGVLYAESNIQAGSTFKNTVEWNGQTDDTYNGDNEATSRGRINSSLFFNHYEVETRSVAFNDATRTDATSSPNNTDNTGQLFVTGGLDRSFSVDASKDYQRLKDPLSSGNDLSRGAGNVSRTFNGEFIQGLHKIESVNGQNLAGNEQKQASPILGNFQIGAYEGILRSYNMSRNIVTYTKPTKMEINAADTVPTDWHQAEMLVPSTTAALATDLATGKIWMPWLADTIYSGSSGGYGKPSSKDMVVEARNTFELKKEDFLLPSGFLQDVTGYYQPTYTKQDYILDINLTGIHNDSNIAANYLKSTTDNTQVPARVDYGINLEDAKIFVNGELLKPPSEQPAGTKIPGQPDPQISVTNLTQNFSGNYDLGLRVNIKDYLREGLNTIVIQTRDATYNVTPGVDNFNESISVVAGPGNTAAVNKVLNNKVISGYNTVGEANYNPDFDRQGLLKVQSRWQTRAVPHTVSPNFTVDPIDDFLGIGGVALGDSAATIKTKMNALPVTDTNFKLYTRLSELASAPETTGSAFKVANSFVEQILNFINQQKYRDIFRMGMMSNLNKIAIQGSANLPSGSSLQGNVSIYYDQKTQMIIVNQDKLVGKS